VYQLQDISDVLAQKQVKPAASSQWKNGDLDAKSRRSLDSWRPHAGDGTGRASTQTVPHHTIHAQTVSLYLVGLKSHTFFNYVNVMPYKLQKPTYLLRLVVTEIFFKSINFQ